jgi:NitT/TauT family transport system substrate-binding protein
MRKTIITIFIIAVVAVLGWVGFQQSRQLTDEKQTQSSGLPMKVPKYYWPGTFWVEIADQKGWFEEAGLNVEIVDSNPDYFGSLQDFVDGKIDTNNFTVFDLMGYISRGIDLVVVFSSDTSVGSEGIIAKPGIDSIAGLQGKRVGVPLGGYLEYILDVVLERNGLSSEDIEKIDILGENAEKEYIREDIDAVIIWEPHVSALEDRGAIRLFDTSEIPGISPSATAFHRDFVNERPEDVQAYASVWHKTVEFIKKNPNEALGIIASIYNVSLEDVISFAEVDKILDLRDNQTTFSYAAGFESLHGTARQINDFMIKQGLSDKYLDSTEFLDSRFIRNLE